MVHGWYGEGKEVYIEVVEELNGGGGEWRNGEWVVVVMVENWRRPNPPNSITKQTPVSEYI